MDARLCGCLAHGGASARAQALFEARLRETKHRLNPDDSLAYRNPTLQAARAEVWNGSRDAHDAEVTYFMDRTRWS